MNGTQTGALSCTLRQTNIAWVLYAYAISQVTYLRYERKIEGQAALHDPLAADAVPCEFAFISDQSSIALIALIVSGSLLCSCKHTESVAQDTRFIHPLRFDSCAVWRVRGVERWHCTR